MNEDYCLWMGDIDPRMDESIIQNILQFYSVYPLAIKLIKDKQTKQNRNYCFIYFKNIFEANNTLNLLNGKPIPNTSLNFKLNWANYHNSTAKTVYVGNLNPSVDDISLFNFFKSKYKSVSKANIITDNGESKRYGFVTFKKKNDYRKSLIEMNGVFFEGTNIKVRENKKKEEDENNKNNKNNTNIQQNLKENNNIINNSNTNNQIELNNEIDNYLNNNNDKLLYTNDLNSNSFSTIMNSINNKLNWISNANPINSVSTCINHSNFVNINNHNNWLNQDAFSENYDNKNNSINFNNSLNGNMYLNYINNDIDASKGYNNFINNDINNIDNIYNRNSINNINIINNINSINKNIGIIDNNKTDESKVNNNQKLEILEEFDEITLKIKINETLNKMLEYYKESYQINRNRVVSKLILFLIFI